MNILERFNIYQEITLGIIYRIFSPKLKPILWYAYSGIVLFYLHDVDIVYDNMDVNNNN